MPDDTLSQPLAVDPVTEQRPGGALIHVAEAGPSRAILRQRRTSDMLMVVGWDCEGDVGALAEALLAFARKRGAVLVRATPDQGAAIAALRLADTGRGYAQRWIGDAIVSPHLTGRYIQSTGFTCGPVSLAMAMGDGVTRSDEIAIWREATTLIGLTGPGGCDPYGMSLAAQRRGFEVTLHFDSAEPVLLDRANTEEKKDLMRFVQAEFRREAEGVIDIRSAPLDADALTEAVRDGARVILLIDQCHTHDHHAPHWVLVHAERDGIFLINDPWAEPEDGEGIADVDCIPVARDTLIRMAAYGDPPYHAALILR